VEQQSLKTERLTLRAPHPDDAEMIALALSDFGVTRWLAQVPYPYSVDMAVEWLARTENCWPELAIVAYEGAAIGCVDTKRASIGYWLTRAAWGKGFMTEAATAMRDDFFQRSTADNLASGFFQGNRASEGVLTKMGFTKAGETTMLNIAQNAELPHTNMTLSRTDWEANQ